MVEPSELVMEESGPDSCQVALQENGACGLKLYIQSTDSFQVQSRSSGW